MEGIVLFLAAAAFTMLNGANDGGTLVAVGLTVRGISPIVAVVGLALAVAIVPVLIGTRVATTLTSRLVSLDGDAGRLALLTAVVSAVVVTAGLSWRGLPTSLTLALVGGIAGVGWGYALPVSWPFIGLVLLLAAVLGLIVEGSVSLVIGILVLVREAVVSLAVLALAAAGARRIDVQWAGKAGTLALMFGLPGLLFAAHSKGVVHGVLSVSAWGFTIAGLGLGYYAAVTYLPLARRALREGRA